MSVCTCARLYALIIPIKRTTPRSGCSIMSVRISARRAFCRHIMFPLLKHITCVARYPTYIQRNERNADRVDRSRVSLTPSMSRARARAAISFSISVDLPGLIDNRTDTPDARCDNSQANEEPTAPPVASLFASESYHRSAASYGFLLDFRVRRAARI